MVLTASLCGCANKNVSNSGDVAEAVKTECEKLDCNKCPDIEPYLEGHNEFWGSQSQMIYWGDKTLESLYKRYDELCNKIIETFKEDEDFVKAFKKDIEAFKNYRNTQRDLIFPRTINYGTIQPNIEWGTDYSLTVGHIEELKGKIGLYCIHNGALLRDDSICSDENINNIFEAVKLKEPKPIIPTPYDNRPE